VLIGGGPGSDSLHLLFGGGIKEKQRNREAIRQNTAKVLRNPFLDVSDTIQRAITKVTTKFGSFMLV
jgi:hypothetical protein